MKSFILNANGKVLDLTAPKIMGVINLNEDSFYPGSRLTKVEEIIGRAHTMCEEGAHILDLGVMSSRPGALLNTAEEEIDLLAQVIPNLLHLDVLLSIDTIHSRTAEFALESGAHIINDISGGRYDPKMFEIVFGHRATYILMHSRGKPEDMATLNSYPNGVVYDVLVELKQQLNLARKVGLRDIVVDPGFGFAKNPEQNFEMMRQLDVFHILDAPLLIGVSRKSMIWKTLKSSPDDALNGTTVLHAYAMQHQPQILRVHDVKQAAETLKLFEKLQIRE